MRRLTTGLEDITASRYSAVDDKLKETLIKVSECSRRVATLEMALNSIVATRRRPIMLWVPALKGRAKFTTTLRVEDLIRAS